MSVSFSVLPPVVRGHLVSFFHYAFMCWTIPRDLISNSCTMGMYVWLIIRRCSMYDFQGFTRDFKCLLRTSLSAPQNQEMVAGNHPPPQLPDVLTFFGHNNHEALTTTVPGADQPQSFKMNDVLWRSDGISRPNHRDLVLRTKNGNTSTVLAVISHALIPQIEVEFACSSLRKTNGTLLRLQNTRREVASMLPGCLMEG